MYFRKKGLTHSLYLHPAVLKITERRPATLNPLHSLSDGGGGRGPSLPLSEDATLILKKTVKGLAFTQLKGAFSPQHGYVIDITKIDLEKVRISKILPSSGLIECHVEYDALVLFPVIGEVVLGLVTAVEKGSILFTYGGVVHGIVALENFWYMDDFVFEEDVEIVDDVAKMMPKFKSLADPKKEIKKGSTVRVKVSKRCPRNGHKDFWLLGSMKDKYLGPVPVPTTMTKKKKESESAASTSKKPDIRTSL